MYPPVIAPTSPQVLLVGSIPRPLGGVTQHVWRLADQLADYGCEVLDLHPNPHKAPIPNVVVRTAPAARWLRPFWMLRELRRTRARIVHCHFSELTHLWWIGRWITQASRPSRVILTLHHGDLSLSWGRLRPRQRTRVRASLLEFSQIVALSPRQREFLEQTLKIPSALICDGSSFVPISSRLLDAVANGSPATSLRSGEEQVLVASGYPQEFYQHEFALRLLEELRHQQRVRLYLCLYGKADSPVYLKRLLKHCERVQATVMNDLDFPEFMDILRQADLYVRPTAADSFGLAVADAITLGVPVVASDICDRFPGSYLVDPWDYEEFAATCQRVLSGEVAGLRKAAKPLALLTPEFYGLAGPTVPRPAFAA